LKLKTAKSAQKSCKEALTLTMQENSNFWRKNIWFYRVKLRKLLTRLTPKELKWFKLSKRSSTWCQNQSKALSQAWWKTTSLTKTVHLSKHWSSAKACRRKSRYWEKRMTFSARYKNWWESRPLKTRNSWIWKSSTTIESYCGPMLASLSLFNNLWRSQTLETLTLKKLINKLSLTNLLSCSSTSESATYPKDGRDKVL